MEVDEVVAAHLRRQFPRDMWIRTGIALLMSVPSIGAALFYTRQPDFALFLLATLVMFFTVNHGLDWGYQFAWDEDWMYQRPKGWRWFFRRLPWYAIRFDKVSKVTAVYEGYGGTKRDFFEFEFIMIYGKSGREGDNVVLYPPAFKDAAIKAFLIEFDTRLPGKLPAEVIEYMHSDLSL